MNNLIKVFLNNNNIQYNDIEKYHEALTHKSYANENRLNISYQRYEFLGDAIIDFIVSDFLFKEYKKIDEGKMSLVRANAVKTKTLATISHEIGLDKLIKLGNNKHDFKNSSKIYADIFESFVAAIYLDLGINSANKFVLMHLGKYLKKVEIMEFKNPKTILQEFLQLEYRKTIIYKTVKVDNIFISEVVYDNIKLGIGKAPSKKQAEVFAAIDALKLVRKVK